jgi:Fe-Mn family superoxide dismutase
LDDKTLGESNAAYGVLREMSVELSFCHNGVILHEMYFGNLGKNSEPSESLKKLITRDFGSWDKFIQHFVAMGKSMRGWAVMGFDMLDGKLRNYGLDQHHEFMPAMFYPLLVLDVYEHAYMIDFGTARAKYLDVFMQNINWQVVDKRLMFAVHNLMSGPKVTE